VRQSMIIEFVHACNEIGKVKPQLPPQPQLWFLQPEQSLSYFGFVKLQTMKFDQVTFPSTNTTGTANASTSATSSVVRTSKQKRHRPDYLGDWDPGDSEKPKGKMQSNCKDYWDATVRTLEQFVGIARISKGPKRSTAEDSIKSVFQEKLKEVAKGTQHTIPVGWEGEPHYRDWPATTAIMTRLLSVPVGLDE